MHTLSLESLAIAFIPVLIVIALMIRNSLAYKTTLYAMARMVLQLLLIGYVLVYIFETEHGLVVLAVLTVMVTVAGWIALRTVPAQRTKLYFNALGAILLGGGATLAVITQGVMKVSPWFEPSVLIPLAGMIFANAMTAISLCAERLHKELLLGQTYETASADAFNAALIPITNALFAVGLVSLPGMMTGQILSGVSPLIAARYQIMVMLMIFGASGLSVILFLKLSKAQFLDFKT